MRKQLSFLLILAGFATLFFQASGQADGKGADTVLVITINGAINPVTSEHIVRNIKVAEEDSSVEALVIEIDTPGGLDTSMREIIKAMQASTKPVIVYVAPSGSRAASAGAFITMAAHVAAMAPSTNIGAATPVNMGGGMDKTMKKKVTNDAAAYIRSIAEAHGRDADWGEKFVRKGASISESEALKNNVVDILADSLPQLLQKIDGTKVYVMGVEKEIKTDGAKINRVEMTWRQKFFDAMANPNVAYILFMLGFYGLLFELYSPGAVLPGVIGAICIILAFYSFQTMPINYAGALLIFLAMIMFTLEVWVPSYGVLSIGGVISLLIGSLMLIDSPDEYLKLSLMVVIPSTLLTGGFFMFIIGAAMRALRKKTVIGIESMVGAFGVAETRIAPGKPGTILFDGDIWQAVSDTETITKGAKVTVQSSSGLTLNVKAS